MDKSTQILIWELLKDIQCIIPQKIIEKEDVFRQFLPYPKTNRVNVGFDVVTNKLTNIKCYIGARTDYSDAFTNDLCKKFQEDTPDALRDLARAVFDPSAFCLTENSFSLLEQHFIPLSFSRNVIAARLNAMPIPKVEAFIKTVFELGGLTTQYDHSRKLTDIIISNNGTKKHPVYIFGVNRNSTGGFDEIKLYYDMYQYDKYDDVYAHNDFVVATETGSVLTQWIDDPRMRTLFPRLVNHFSIVDGVLAIFGVNYRIDGTKVYKFYFTDGNEEIKNRREFMSELHRIIFGEKMTDDNLNVLQLALDHGFSPAEMCIATDGKNAMMKTYFSSAY